MLRCGVSSKSFVQQVDIDITIDTLEEPTLLTDEQEHTDQQPAVVQVTQDHLDIVHVSNYNFETTAHSYIY